MSKLLDDGIKAIRGLPEDQQDAAGKLLLSLADTRSYELSVDQIEGIAEAQAQVSEGRFADDASVKRIFGNRFK